MAPLDAIRTELPELGGMLLVSVAFAGGLRATDPAARARRRATRMFRLRRRRNFWRYLLGWGELPPPWRVDANGATPEVAALVHSILEADGFLDRLSSDIARHVRRIPQETSR